MDVTELKNFLIWVERNTHFFEDKDITAKQVVQEYINSIGNSKTENECASTKFLNGLLTRLLKGQHEVIDGAFRKEIVPVEHIKKTFGSLAIYADDTIPF